MTASNHSRGDDAHDLNPWSSTGFWNERFADGELPWELGGPSPTLAALEARWGDGNPKRVLVPGCGRGDDALFFAERGHDVLAVDWAEAAVEATLGRARARGLSLQAEVADFFALPPTEFDWIVEQTFFCAIDPGDHPRYVQQSARLLSDRGMLLGALFVGDVAPPDSSLASEGPPFLTKESEVRAEFSKFYTLEQLEPSRVASPRRAAVEWSAAFRRK